jgi:hypothetical protein
MNKIAGSVGIIGRQESDGQSQNGGEDPSHVEYYSLTLSNTGAWSINRSDFSGTVTSLASGTAPSAAGLGAWHQLALTFDGSDIVASVDGTTVGSVIDTAYGAGKVGLLTSGYTAGDQFDNLSVTPLTDPAVPVTLPSNGGTPLMTTIPYSATGSGVDQWTYNGSWSSGGGNTWSDTPGDTAALTFKGSAVTLDSIVYNGQGIVNVSVDGGPATPVDLYRATSNGFSAPVFTANQLDPSVTHTLTVTVTGT